MNNSNCKTRCAKKRNNKQIRDCRVLLHRQQSTSWEPNLPHSCAHMRRDDNDSEEIHLLAVLSSSSYSKKELSLDPDVCVCAMAKFRTNRACLFQSLKLKKGEREERIPNHSRSGNFGCSVTGFLTNKVILSWRKCLKDPLASFILCPKRTCFENIMLFFAEAAIR